MEAQGVVDKLERQFIDGGGIGAPRGRGQLGGLAVGQQDLRAVGQLGNAIAYPLLPVRLGAVEQIEPFVRAAHAAHPPSPVADAHDADDALDARIDGADPHDGGAAVAGAVDAETRRIDAGLQAEEGERSLDIGDP